jgi:hypothetical protein
MYSTRVTIRRRPAHALAAVALASVLLLAAVVCLGPGALATVFRDHLGSLGPGAGGAGRARVPGPASVCLALAIHAIRTITGRCQQAPSTRGWRLASTPRKSRAVRQVAGTAVAVAATFAVLPMTATEAVAAGSTTYYVSPTGSDSASGTDAAHPLKSLGRASDLLLRPGDRVLLQRGATFHGKLAVWRSGSAARRITIGSYGAANQPKPTVQNNPAESCLEVGASYITVTGIHVTDCHAGIWSRGTHNLITHVEATHNVHGIEVALGSQQTRVMRNYLHDNDRMAPHTPGAYDDYGAVGVVVLGDDTEIGYNRISNNHAPSADFGVDGSAVEIYGGIGTLVHHNTATNNRTFTELGNSRSADTTFAYNVSRSNLKDSEFLITRGSSDTFGPVRGTVAVHNTVRMSGANSLGYSCYAGCTPNTLRIYRNIFDVAGRIGYLEGSLSGGHNVYRRGRMSVPMLAGDRYAGPRGHAGRGPVRA